MSQLNGNDIDDLFRRASDKYPLRTDNADWERLAADLDRDPSMILPPISEEGNRRRRRLLWLFFLLPLGGLGYYTWFHNGHGSTPSSAISRSAGQKKTGGSSSTRSNTTISNPTSSTPVSSSSVASVRSGGTSSSINPNSSSIPSGGVTPSGREIARRAKSFGPAANGAGGNMNEVAGGGNTNSVTRNGKRNSVTRDGHAKKVRGSNHANEASGSSDVNEVLRSSNRNEVTGGDANNTGGIHMTGVAGSNGSIHPMGTHSLSLAPTSREVALNVRVQAPNTVVPGPASTTKLAKPRNQTHFYAGLMAAPDLSTVKLQSVKSVGTTFSLLVGYNINSKWAIESGVSLDRKKYYTDGEYFSKAKINLYNNNLLNVNGICNMWEVPINLRYNISQGPKARWFATTGLSTYFMSKEQYAYKVENMNTGNIGNYSKTYTTPSNYLFSVVNLSIGYEQKIGNIGNRRLEPYLRVPLSGIGTGSLPIMSAGLNIGITRRIW